MKKLATVTKALNEAVSASGTMYNSCQKAAGAAAKQLDAAKALKERINEVVSCYAEVYGDNHNVKAIFKDALTLHACAQDPVSIEVKKGKGKDAKVEELHTTAEEAAKLPKHQMRQAAKEVREAHGLGRKAGGGRKNGKAETVTPTEVVTESDAVLTTFMGQLDEVLANEVAFAKLKAHLNSMGLNIVKARAKTH